MSEFSVATGGDSQHRCARCRTFVEAYDLMVGISVTTLGITGTRHWVHLDCVEQYQAQELVDSLDALLQGYGDLTPDDQALVSESLQDLSQGLNLHRWEKRKKEGRTQPLHKHQEAEGSSPSLSSIAPFSPSPLTVESPNKVATPWYVVAQQKRKQEAQEGKTFPSKKLQASRRPGASETESKVKSKTNDEQDGTIDTVEDGMLDKEASSERKRAKKEKKQAKKEKKEKEKKEKKAKKREGKNANAELSEPGTSKKAEPGTSKKSEPGTSKKKGTSDALLMGGPDKPKTEFWYYCAAKRPDLERSNPHLGQQSINQELSEGWKNLDKTARAEFEEYHARDKRRYNRQLIEFTQYGSFTVEIEQVDDPNISDTLTKHCPTDSRPPVQEKHTQSSLKNLFTQPQAEVQGKPQLRKAVSSFHKGALKPVSRLL